ncbi:MAG: hypothetical protein LBJ93_03600 [Clostridiales bacterium]|nr:hypothetical protein [Clostridiales bacterium]
MTKIFNNSKISIRQFQIMIVIYLLSVSLIFIKKISYIDLLLCVCLSIFLICIFKNTKIKSKNLKRYLLLLFLIKIILAFYFQVRFLSNMFSRDQIFFLGLASIYLSTKSYETRARLSEILFFPFLIALLIIIIKSPNTKRMTIDFNYEIFPNILLFCGLDYLFMSQKLVKNFDINKILQAIFLATLIIIFFSTKAVSNHNFFQICLLISSSFYFLSLNFWFLLRFLDNSFSCDNLS